MSFFEDAFITILNMSITASFAAIAVIIARLPLKKAPKVFSYILWSVVLFRLIFPFSFSSPFSLLSLIQPGQTASIHTQYIPRNIGMMDEPSVNTGIDSVNSAINALLPAAAPYASVNPMQIIIWSGTIIWLAGIAILLIYAAASCLRLKKRVSTATLVSDNVSDFIAPFRQAGAEKPYHIYETDLIRSPFVYGLVKPKIYLPLSLQGQEREYILCHELTHIRRLDYLVKPVAFLALVLHWFNPVIWLCSSLMTKDLEMSCDESVMKQYINAHFPCNKDIDGPTSVFRNDSCAKTNYSSSLLVLAANRKFPSPSPLAFGESNVKARIKNILNYKKPAFWVTIISIIAVAALTAVLASDPLNAADTVGNISNGYTSHNTSNDYDIEFLLKNKTEYVGNNVKIGSLIDGMPLPEGVDRGTFELSTSEPPYGVTCHYILEDDSIKVSEEQFLRNSILLFALVDNVDNVTHTGHWKNDLLSSVPFEYSYTRADADKVVGGDVRQFGRDKKSLSELIEVVEMLKQEKGKTSMKGLELYVWRKPELTGSDDIYYTLLTGTNRNKTDEEVYDLSKATTNIEDINRELADYGEIDIFVSHPLYISKEEMTKIADQIQIKNGSVAVGTGWFEKDPSEK
ncbi:MAG: M56 family metallopeptidase [Clostridiaceae bacterium]